MDYEFVALTREDEYAIYDGEVLSSTGRRVTAKDYDSAYLETHVQHSNALHSHTKAGSTYFVGPLARLNLNYSQLRPAARQAAEKAGVSLPMRNPFKNLLARAIELVKVCELAIELEGNYQPTGPSYAEIKLHS